jgi:hypothetical protein
MTAEEKQVLLRHLRDEHGRYGDPHYRWAEGPHDTRDDFAGPFFSRLGPAWLGLARRFRRAAGLVLIAIFPVLPVSIRSLQAGTPDWLRAAAQTPLANYSDNTNAVVLLDEQITTITESGEVRTLYRRAYRILRPEGRRYGMVAVAFDKETHLNHLRAWSIPHQGNDYEVKDKDAVETQVFAQLLYQDTREKLLEIPAADPGNVIGYEYEQRRRPSIPQDTWRFQHDIPVRRARFELQMPTGWEYSVFWVNHAAEKPQAAGQNGWVWELNDLPAVESEPSMPAWHSLAGRLGVTYYPRRANAGTGSFGSWPAIARWYGHLAAERRQPNSEIRQKVTELTASAATLLDKIQALAAFVQSDIRYVGIEIGIGGYQPHPAADVFTNRYGDCKDKATLLASMLAVAGIKSYYVLIDATRGVVAPESPSALDFDHVILAIQVTDASPGLGLWAVQEIPKLGKLLFFDPTHPFVPLGFLPENLQANCGLVVTDEGGELVRLPLLPAAANRLTRVAKLSITPNGTLYGTVTELRWGAPAAELRGRLLRASQADRQKVLEDFLGQFVGGSVLQGAGVENLDKLDANLMLQYTFSATEYAKVSGDLLVVRPRVLGSKGEKLLDVKERRYPVEFPASISQGDVFEITVPDGYTVDELPEPVELSTGATSYKSKAEMNGKVLHYTRLYQITDVRVPTEHLKELKQFYRQVAADERSSAVFKKRSTEQAGLQQ